MVEGRISPAIVIPIGLGLGLVAAVVVYSVARAAPPPGVRPPCNSYGDIDGDGWVTEADAELAAQYNIGIITLTTEQLHRADVNGDGQVTGGDAMLISQYAAGTIDTFPVCEVIPGQVTVTLKYPGLMNRWQIAIYSPDKTEVRSKYNLGIAEPATFDIPADWQPPFLVNSIMLYVAETNYVGYEVQGFSPDLPNYKEIFIPNYGNYYFNVSSEGFEKI